MSEIQSQSTQNPYETWTDKAKRKFSENPWVPIGCIATTGALVMSAVKMRQGRSKHMNYWLRARVVLQGLTLVALVGGAMSIRDIKKKQEEKELGIAGDASEEEKEQEKARKKRELEKAAFESRLEEARQVVEQENAAGLMGRKVVAGPVVNTARRDEEERKRQAAKAEVEAKAAASLDAESAPETTPTETTTSAVKKSSSWKFWSKKDGSD